MSNEQATEVKEKKSGKTKIIIAVVLAVVLAIAAGVGFYFVNQRANYLTTDNARVTTTLVDITSTMPGVLERFTVLQGQYVTQNEILGWVEGGEAMRAPFDGLVVRTYAEQNQVVAPHTPLAVIADTNNLHIEANFEEQYIGRIALGQEVSVTIDALGGRQFRGYIAEIGRITDVELTGMAMFFNTGGTFTRVVRLLPVRVNIVDDVELDSLIGLNARVRISLR
ncbi:MAG: efflux RND transporter periplasmic adaptor subunit [Defluviitaleaceae bacterium]|nr:efflux RND transporter periplasmic adaptor subunit [Defluviitaleaceae bacterium]